MGLPRNISFWRPWIWLGHGTVQAAGKSIMYEVKVSKSLNIFFLKLHCPKNKRYIWQNSALASEGRILSNISFVFLGNRFSRKNAFEIYWPLGLFADIESSWCPRPITHEYQKKSHGNSTIRFPIFGHEKKKCSNVLGKKCVQKTFIFDTRTWIHQTLLVKCHMNAKSHTSRYIRIT